MQLPRTRIAWSTPAGKLLAIEPHGHVVDDSPAARAYAEDPADIMGIARATFERLYAPVMADIHIEVR